MKNFVLFGSTGSSIFDFCFFFLITKRFVFSDRKNLKTTEVGDKTSLNFDLLTYLFQTTNLTSEQMRKQTNVLMSNMDALLKDLNSKAQAQKNADEQERLRKIQVI